ncbi:hypothetical protein Agabi119p4_6162 [Agaricus bisporus var. burnettii]|uniref:Uncharacterized protein n=1 Tax=Agaricus bisporus var. burnettii TaxID=192524 RepID=A0A8H7F1C3_AGABI|nr:hypothetical protein Agabi119p4_6162 [Agaricus bisporus var. burnettii]
MHSRCSTEAYSIRITHLDWLIGNHHSWYLEVFAAEVAGCVYSTTTTTTKMRRLTLHTSALNDAEYDLYTSSIQDLALVDSNLSNGRDDTFYEQISLGVREVRAWLRGRYQDTPVNTIDAILKLFSPTLSPAETLAGGEFFAVLRLVLHVQSGKAVDRNLVFVQAHPHSPYASVNNSNNRNSVESQRRSVDSAVLSVTSEPPLSAPNPFTGQQPPLHPSQRQDTPKLVHSPNNPFVARSKSISAKSENGSSRLPPLPPRKPSAPPPPPRHASGSTVKSPRIIPDHAPSIAQPHFQSHQHHPPPPPPPKPKPVTHVTSPLIKRSLHASKVAQTIKQVEDERGRERVLQVLRSSAVGSGSSARNNDSLSRSPAKKAPASLPLSMEAKSDSSASWSGGDERERPPLPRRPRQLHAASPSMSSSSLEQVALAVVPSGSRSHPTTPFIHSPFESPAHSPRASLDSPSLPPPTHPDRKSYQPYQPRSAPPDNNQSHPGPTSPSVFHRDPESFEAIYEPNRRSSTSSLVAPNSPTPTSDTFPEHAKVLRSKSLHQYKPYIPPPPPPARRKRPESVQVLTNGQAFFGVGQSNDSNNALKNSVTQSPSKVHRRASYSSSFGGSVASAPASTNLGGGGGTDAIQRKLAELQLKAENALPKLEAAMFKAEAGISRRGFIQGSPSRGRDKSSSRSENGGQDREGLMSGYDGDQYEDHGGSDGEMVERNGLSVSVDSRDESCLRGRKEDRNGIEKDRDNLKWPAGEGWKEL